MGWRIVWETIIHRKEKKYVFLVYSTITRIEIKKDKQWDSANSILANLNFGANITMMIHLIKIFTDLILNYLNDLAIN